MIKNVLIIDCSAGNYVGVISDENYFELKDDLPKSDSILSLVENCLTKAGLQLKDIQALATNIGPGSFTGLRVGVTVIKGLSIVNNLPIISYSSFEAIRANLNSQEKDNSIIILDGFSNFLYVDVDNGQCLEVSQVVDIVKKTQKRCVCDEKVAKKLNLGLFLQKNTTPLNIVKLKLKNQEFILANAIEPLYLRASQAEIERDKKLNAGTKKS